ncbi:MAG: tyrosine-type recombinase/integrase [Fuerstiella sp.]
MASAHKDAKGWQVCYIDQDNARRSLRPGKGTNKATANQIARQIDVLVASKASGGTVELTTAKWLGGIGEKLHAKLVRAGLTAPKAAAAVEPDQEPSISLAAFLDEFVADGTTLKGNPASSATLRKWSGTRDLLLRCFDGARPLNSMVLADAKEFRKWMERRKLPQTKRTPTGKMAENSMRQRMANCKTFFSYAVREELIPGNPFRNQASSLQKNDNGKENICTEIIDKVIQASPNAEWRLLVALWRYCGLRKSEPMELDWNDVLWAEGKIRVRSPKTAHHAGREMRYVPIRDVETYLSDAFEVAPKGQKHIFGRYVNANSLFHTFEQIVENAGYQPWPNLIKNLRLSCENDWLDAGEAPAHVIAAWIGHSVTVQNSSYAIVSDGHFDQFNARRQDDLKSGDTGGNKPPRIDANDDETSASPKMSRRVKMRITNNNTGLGKSDLDSCREPVFSKDRVSVSYFSRSECIECVRRMRHVAGTSRTAKAPYTMPPPLAGDSMRDRLRAHPKSKTQWMLLFPKYSPWLRSRCRCWCDREQWMLLPARNESHLNECRHAPS